MRKYFLLILLLSFSICFAQIERETRAVWLTTNHRLDWPPATYDQEKQKKSLIEIFDDLKNKNLNTVYFQVRMNGTVLFKSSFESLSSYITGELDGQANYDPLQFAIEQAHKRGLEIHAWVNVNLVYSTTESNILKDSNHLLRKKPEWIVEDIRDGQKSFWMDPGIPEARNYVSDLITEMVENYDVDGVHLDYMRYPGKNFNDDATYKLYGNNQSRDEFRRNNINSLVEEIGKKIKSVNQFIKLGAAPIGVYKRLKGMNAWESYYDLYQDSYGWLKKGLVDYLTPQIYWAIEENPHFDILAKDWSANSSGRSVVLGIGAYKDNVKPEIDDMIKLSRSIHTSGVAFFRYQHIKDLSFPLFQHKTFPTAMPWLDGLFPPAPQNLSFTYDKEKNIYSLRWELSQIQSEKDSVSYVSIYNLAKKSSPTKTEYLFEVVPVNHNSLSIVIDKPKKVNYYFALRSVNKIWNESVDASNVIGIKVPQMNSISLLGFESEKPVLMKDTSGATSIIFISNQIQQVKFLGRKESSLELIKKEIAVAGRNIFQIESLIDNYTAIKVVLEKENREFELKFKSM